MQYTYSESCSLKRTVGTETERLRTQLISVLYKNVATATSAGTILTACTTWAGYIRDLKYSTYSYDNDRKIHFASQDCFVNSDTQQVDITFICKRVTGGSSEWIQFALLNETAETLSSHFQTKLVQMAGDADAFQKYIIVNAIIDM